MGVQQLPQVQHRGKNAVISDPLVMIRSESFLWGGMYCGMGGLGDGIVKVRGESSVANLKPQTIG